jgi:ribosomal protein S18 acetylase RimI-like enzyme
MEIVQSSEYKADIINLYIEAFSTGQSEQFIDLEELNKYVDSILEHGYALLAIENNQPIGAALICPLTLDKALPTEISQKFNADKCLYIAEMMVTEAARGKGVGKKLLEEFETRADKAHFQDAFIRVWIENTPAVNLYQKMGFEVIASIEQTKKTADGNGTFVMQKIYLHKKLN